MNHLWIRTNGLNLHVVEAGPTAGRLIILLHGFPEFWYSWRRQIPHFATAGYRVWAPDQRGYNLSDKPEGIAAYTIDALAADVVGLIDASGQQQAIVVGHDWGAAVAWWVAQKYPERVFRMVAINAPHGSVLLNQLRNNPRQLLRSWYMAFFQLPWLPEYSARQQNWRMLVNNLRNSSRPGTFSDADLNVYREAWSQPRAFSAMLHWYRALIRQSPTALTGSRITVPALLIWGAQDQFLGRELAQPSIDLCDHGRLVFIENASHWVQLEEAQQVNQLIDRFIGSDFDSCIQP